MASKAFPDSTPPPRRRRTVLFAGVALFALTVALGVILVACGGSTPQMATPPPFGSPRVVTGNVIPCPSGFYSNSTTAAVCHAANLAGCPNASNLNFTYSYDNPGSPKGTIVFISGDGGISGPGDEDFADFYFTNGYEIVQIQWAYDWENTTVPVQDTGGTDTTNYVANIQVAACRQATFLNFVFNMNNSNLYSGGGRCAQGSSAGSAAIAFALTYYGAQNYLDLAEMKSGPPLSDIEQGCEVPNNIQITVCGTQNGAPQFGCQLGGTSPWTLSPEYTDQASGVQGWTNDNSCANGQTTSAASNQAWLQQSIVNDGTNNPTFSYPKTAITAWLCQSVFNNNLCTGGSTLDGGQGGSPEMYCPNNSSSQAEIYFAKLTNDPNSLPQAPYSIYAVQNCDGSEGVSGPDATVAALNNPDGTPKSGTDAIEQDMLTQCVKH